MRAMELLEITDIVDYAVGLARAEKVDYHKKRTEMPLSSLYLIPNCK